MQAYAEAAAAGGGAPLCPEGRWAAGVALVAALGDPASAERLRGELNNQYRLARVVDILLQTGGRPLAGGWGRGGGGRERRTEQWCAAVCAATGACSRTVWSV